MSHLCLFRLWVIPRQETTFSFIWLTIFISVNGFCRKAVHKYVYNNNEIHIKKTHTLQLIALFWKGRSLTQISIGFLGLNQWSSMPYLDFDATVSVWRDWGSNIPWGLHDAFWRVLKARSPLRDPPLLCTEPRFAVLQWAHFWFAAEMDITTFNKLIINPDLKQKLKFNYHHNGHLFPNTLHPVTLEYSISFWYALWHKQN